MERFWCDQSLSWTVTAHMEQGCVPLHSHVLWSGLHLQPGVSWCFLCLDSRCFYSLGYLMHCKGQTLLIFHMMPSRDTQDILNGSCTEFTFLTTVPAAFSFLPKLNCWSQHFSVPVGATNSFMSSRRPRAQTYVRLNFQLQGGKQTSGRL